MTFANRHLNSICKRTIDVMLSLMGLITAAPLMALISAAVWIDSPGHVIFAQERIGLKGKRFKMYKFRKFPPTWGDDGPAVTGKNDLRMTKVGTILERAKLDELPQFWNILKGDMSLVGPRPELPTFADLFKGKHAEVLEHLPGIFGPNQIKFRNECESYPPDEDPESFYRRVLFPRKAETDLHYFERATCLTDLALILKGVWVTVVGLVSWPMFLKRQAKVIILDALLVALSWFLANIFRFSGLPNDLHFELMVRGFPVIPVLFVLAMAVGGCYRHPPWYFSLDDALRLALTTSFTCLLTLILALNFHRAISLYVFPIFLFVLLTLMAAPRIVSRVRWQKKSDPRKGTNRIAIYGVGRAGIALAALIGNGKMVGFVDDNPGLKGRFVGGRRVLGYEGDIDTIFRVQPFEELWLTFIPSREKLHRLKRLCANQNIKLHVLPEIEPFSGILNRWQ